MRTVGVRFRPAGKVYTFDAGDMEFRLEDQVIVETERGMSLGRIASSPAETSVVPPQPYKKVVRLAEERDVIRSEENRRLEVEARKACIDLVIEKKLDMKLLNVECLFDRSKVIFYFAAEGRVDFRELVRDLARQFHARIEMRQVGVRDEAKMVGGLGCCGRELCCATWLVEFAPISVRMAKSQNISLNPAKISGICGRLMCCLSYENKMYEQLSRGMPKVGKKVETRKGEGKVVRRNALEGTFVVFTEAGEVEITLEEWEQARKGDQPAPPGAAAEEKAVVEVEAEEAGEECEALEGQAEGEDRAEGEAQEAAEGSERRNPRRRRRRRKKPPQARENKADG